MACGETVTLGHAPAVRTARRIGARPQEIILLGDCQPSLSRCIHEMIVLEERYWGMEFALSRYGKSGTIRE